MPSIGAKTDSLKRARGHDAPGLPRAPAGESVQPYAPSAYTPDQVQRRPPRECLHSRKFKLFAAGGRRLPHRDPTLDISPMRDWRHNTPKQLREREADSEMAKYQDPEYRQDLLGRWDEECLRYTRPTKKTFLFGLVHGFGIVGMFWLSPIALLVVLYGAFERAGDARGGVTFNNFSNNFDWHFLLVVFMISFTMWGGMKLLRKFAPNFAAGLQSGPAWELNRRTGEVVVSANSRKKSTAWQVGHRLPFHEFDCYLQSTPTPQGLPQYYLSLVHYAEEVHVRLADVFGSTTSHVEQRAAWDMLQRYMDSSQPLPDIPMMEPDRPRDPASREHDRRTGRDPRYWRDMDDATYERHVSENQDKLNAFYRGIHLS